MGSKSVRNMQRFCQNKVEKQCILLAFIIIIYQDARSVNVKFVIVLLPFYLLYFWNLVCAQQLETSYLHTSDWFDNCLSLCITNTLGICFFNSMFSIGPLTFRSKEVIFVPYIVNYQALWRWLKTSRVVPSLSCSQCT